MRVKRVLFLIVFTFIALASFAENFDANFKNVSLKDFLLFVSEFTGKSIVYDESKIRGQITIDTKSKLTKDNLLEIMNTVLSMNNLYALDKGTYLQILKKNEVREIDDRFVDVDNVTKNDFITTVLYFDGIDVSKIASSLARLKSKYGDVQVLKGANVVVIRDTADRILKIKDIINKISKLAGSYELKAYSIKNSSASNIEKNITKFFKQLQAQALVSFNPIIIADDFTNTLIVAAKEDDINKIEYIINQLDVSNDNSALAPQVFKLKHVYATDVEGILNKLLLSNIDPKKKKVVRSKVAADKSTNSIIALGDKELYSNIQQLLEKLDKPRKQVYVEALVLETSIEKGADFGVEWLAGGGNENFAGSAGFLNNGALTNFQSPVLEGNSPNFAALPGGFTAAILGNVITYEGVKFPTLSALVNFVKTDSAINIISNPQILTLDNEEAEVFVGENRPFLTSTKFDANNNPVQSYDYRDVGIRLKITPHISDNKTLTLKIEQEVKKVIANAGNDLTAPITLTRKTKTMVELIDGYTMVISGLIGDDTSVSNSEVPFLSKIPILGWLFKSRNRSRSKTNMMVFITAKVINTRQDIDLITSEKKQFMKVIKEQNKKKLGIESEPDKR
ncbi:general secretion pathway protein D [Deferribacter desulfuricans SSM1]|uniref:General secretion pathway protein D n=1 Tax=Deferribacter desulfuricans (strain DSM 14783 / JCM 11476 / NBRC 101012 / SSM1) TaxID=639282 RepID=D3PDV2_DEFDS|nr:type II secretion system secretin GspD [Deferribacter desulfuricans]BAI80775.1 general secretion pathway protein D [Deferribacter desulfuricans SSM1]